MDINRGGRPKKLQVELDDNGLREILQRVYVEAEDVRQKSLLVFNKTIRKMKENNDVALIGKTTAEYLKIAASATTSKLQIAKIIQDQIIKVNNADNSEDDSVNGGFVISDDIKEELASIHSDMQKQLQRIPEGGKMMDVNKALDNIEAKEMEKIKNNGK